MACTDVVLIMSRGASSHPMQRRGRATDTGRSICPFETCDVPAMQMVIQHVSSPAFFGTHDVHREVFRKSVINYSSALHGDVVSFTKTGTVMYPEGLCLSRFSHLTVYEILVGTASHRLHGKYYRCHIAFHLADACLTSAGDINFWGRAAGPLCTWRSRLSPQCLLRDSSIVMYSGEDVFRTMILFVLCV